MGAQAYNLIEKYKSELPNNSVIVEIGSTRGEFSSDYFDNLVHLFYLMIHLLIMKYGMVKEELQFHIY